MSLSSCSTCGGRRWVGGFLPLPCKTCNPTDADLDMARLTAELAECRAENNSARTAAEQYASAYDRVVEEKHALIADRDAARAEVERMRPVLAAAIKIAEWGSIQSAHEYGCGNSRPCDGCAFREAIGAATRGGS